MTSRSADSTFGAGVAVRRVWALAVTLGAVGALASGGEAFGQLTPARPCAIAKHPIGARLAAVEGGAGADPAIELIEPGTGKVLETKEAKAGEVDLGELFPRLWATERPQVLYAQAVVGGVRVGAPVVLVPMVPPRYAPKGDRDGFPQLPAGPRKPAALAGYWTYTDQRAVITTSKGELVFALRPDAAPNSVRNFRQLAGDRFYDDTAVHRIASLSGRTLPDIVQFGDPTGGGQGGPGWFIDFEPSTLKHAYGTLSYARLTGTEPNSAGSQVVICLGQQVALDGRFTAFGQMVAGSAVLTAISKTPADANGKPREKVEIKSIKLVDAPPLGSGPEPEKDPLERATGR